MKKEKPIEINVLGTTYTIYFLSTHEDNYLKQCDGYCDFSTKKIVVKKDKEDSDVDDYMEVRRKNLRHEIIHAYMGESGLRANFFHPEYGHDETTVDWFAIQFPKIYKTFEQLNIVD